MADTVRNAPPGWYGNARKPFGVLEECPRVREDGKVRGFGCGESIPPGADRRHYKRRAAHIRRRSLRPAGAKGEGE